jgi:hypothetical protein
VRDECATRFDAAGVWGGPRYEKKPGDPYPTYAGTHPYEAHREFFETPAK